MFNQKINHFFSGKAVLLFAMLGILVAVTFTAPKAVFAMSDESVIQSNAAATYWGPTADYDLLTHSELNNGENQMYNPTNVANPWKETGDGEFGREGRGGGGIFDKSGDSDLK